MGLTIRVKSSKATARPIDMGGGGFLRLRSRVAMLYGEPWASHYKTLIEHPVISSDDSFYDEFDKKTEQLIREKKVSIKIVDFCLQSDIEGSIHYGACKEILKAIGDYDDNVCYGYAGLPSCAKFRDFKAILEDCVRLKCDMVWD